MAVEINNFPKLAMARFSEQFHGQNLVSMHATNPEPFAQIELEQTIGQSFNQILKDVNLGFAPDAGTHGLRQTLAKYHYETIMPNQIVTHAGAQEALFCAFYALLRKNDKVLAVAPIFEPLVQIPLNIGCDVSYVRLQAVNNWSLDIDAIEAHFKQGCKLFIINFPHNPTGATISESELLRIVSLCKSYNVWLLSDEVFRGLEHSEDYRLPAVADLYDKGISIGVISKGFAIPGIRVGWLVCKNNLLCSKVVDIKGYLSVCNSQVDELLASVILREPEKLTQRNLEIILPNKELLNDFNSILGHSISIIIPNVGCCLFAQVREPESLVQEVASETGFLLYPSVLFKTDVEAIRIGFGSRRFKHYLESMR